MPPEPTAVTGIGMATPVGPHAAQSAASVRAGVHRFRVWPHGHGRCEGLVASFVEPDLGDRPLGDKVFSLLGPVVEEALLQAGLADRPRLEALASRGRLRLLVAVPEAAKGAADRGLAGRLGAGLLPDGIPLPAELAPPSAGGFAGALLQAARALQEEKADVVLVAGVDSLLDAGRLDALAEADRLKLPGESSGLIPGEGAACLVLEAPGQARSRGQAELLRVLGAAAGRQAPFSPEAPTSADAAVSAAEAAAATGGGLSAFQAACVDLNGERWRFLEWAMASARLGDRLARGWSLHHPGDCWGDTGAAFGPLALGLAGQAWQRGAWSAARALVLTTHEGGERHAVAIARPERR